MPYPKTFYWLIYSYHGNDLSRLGLGLGLGLQGLYSATNCADNILGRFTIILQNQIARVDSFTNLTKRWVFRFRLNASISSHNLIFFGKQFHARGPYTANARLPKVSCLNFGTFRTRSSLDLMEYLLLFDGVIKIGFTGIIMTNTIVFTICIYVDFRLLNDRLEISTYVKDNLATILLYLRHALKFWFGGYRSVVKAKPVCNDHLYKKRYYLCFIQ